MYSEVNGPERSYNDQFYVSIYMCVHCTRGLKAYSQQLIYNFRKVQHCTGYPLIQVETVSVCKSHYMHWLASQSSCMLTSLFLECVVILQLSPVWVQVQVQVQVQVHLLQVQECLLQFPPFFLKI